jgi:hypothetical protein
MNAITTRFQGHFARKPVTSAEEQCPSTEHGSAQGPRRVLLSWRPALRSMSLQPGAAGALPLRLTRALLLNDGEPE